MLDPYSPPSHSDDQTDRSEYSISALAQHSGSSIRNIRAYQDRGILAPPRKQGRIGLYDNSHLKRLTLIQALLARGFSINNIAEMLEAQHRGDTLERLLGLQQTLSHDWPLPVSQTIPLTELLARFASPPTAEEIQLAIRSGLITPKPADQIEISNPDLIEAAAGLSHAGLPLLPMIQFAQDMSRHFGEGLRSFGLLAINQLFTALQQPQLSPATEATSPVKKAGLNELAEQQLSSLTQLRPVILKALEAELSRVLSVLLGQIMADQVNERLQQQTTERKSS